MKIVFYSIIIVFSTGVFIILFFFFFDFPRTFEPSNPKEATSWTKAQQPLTLDKGQALDGIVCFHTKDLVYFPSNFLQQDCSRESLRLFRACCLRHWRLRRIRFHNRRRTSPRVSLHNPRFPGCFWVTVRIYIASWACAACWTSPTSVTRHPPGHIQHTHISSISLKR